MNEKEKQDELEEEAERKKKYDEKLKKEAEKNADTPGEKGDSSKDSSENSQKSSSKNSSDSKNAKNKRSLFTEEFEEMSFKLQTQLMRLADRLSLDGRIDNSRVIWWFTWSLLAYKKMCL